MFSQVFQIPFTAFSFFFLPPQAFVGPLGEPTTTTKKGSSRKQKRQGRRREGVRFSPYQFHSLFCPVAAQTLPAQRSELHWPESKVLADREGEAGLWYLFVLLYTDHQLWCLIPSRSRKMSSSKYWYNTLLDLWRSKTLNRGRQKTYTWF